MASVADQIAQLQFAEQVLVAVDRAPPATTKIIMPNVKSGSTLDVVRQANKIIRSLGSPPFDIRLMARRVKTSLELSITLSNPVEQRVPRAPPGSQPVQPGRAGGADDDGGD